MFYSTWLEETCTSIPNKRDASGLVKRKWPKMKNF